MSALGIAVPESYRLADRGHAIRELVSQTVGHAGLPHRAEQDLREVLVAQIEPILAAADSAVAARAELEAIDRRLDNHVRHVHPRCAATRPCWIYRVLQIRRARLQRQADRQFRRLLGGAR